MMSDNTHSGITRQLLHTRKVTCTGYLRSDGWFDFEGHLHDSKTYAETTPYKAIAAGEPIHCMSVYMTIDRTLVIQSLEATTEAAPTPFCSQINAAYTALKGLQIGTGFRQQVMQRVGRLQGCTHLTELLWPMATTIFQTTGKIFLEEQLQRAEKEPDYVVPQHWVIGGCHAYHPDGEPARLLLQQTGRKKMPS